MLEEAARNTRDLSNVSLLHASQLATLRAASFDFIHSLMVFQHIPVKRGEEIFERLLTLLKSGGVGAIHFTIELPAYHRTVFQLRRIRLFHYLTNVLERRPVSEAPMQIYKYLLNRLFAILESAKCGPILSDLTHGGMLIFRKNG